MANSFHHDMNSVSGNHVCDDEEIAVQLQAEELAFQLPSRNNLSEGSLHEEAQIAAHDAWSDLELAKNLQVREDEQSMLTCAAENGHTDLEVAKILQMDVDEEMASTATTEDNYSDMELAQMLQQQEDIAANDFLIAKQLQEELEQEGPKRCQRCGQQSCQCHACGNSHLRIRHLVRHADEGENIGEGDDSGDDSGAFRDLMFRQHFPPSFALPGLQLAGVPLFGHDNGEDDEYENLLELGEMIGEARSQGLALEELNALPTSSFTSKPQSSSTTCVKNDSDSDKCHVCFCDFSNNDVLRTLPCLHRFHRDCIDQWIQRKADCPVCRVAIKDHIGGSSSH